MALLSALLRWARLSVFSANVCGPHTHISIHNRIRFLYFVTAALQLLRVLSVYLELKVLLSQL